MCHNLQRVFYGQKKKTLYQHGSDFASI